MAIRQKTGTQMTLSLRRTNPPGSPFRHKTFAVIWTATVVSNVGWWMYTAASGWLMISLNSAPLVVSLVQVANSLSRKYAGSGLGLSIARDVARSRGGDIHFISPEAPWSACVEVELP